MSMLRCLSQLSGHLTVYIYIYVGVSLNGGTQQWMVYNSCTDGDFLLRCFYLFKNGDVSEQMVFHYRRRVDLVDKNMETSPRFYGVCFLNVTY